MKPISQVELKRCPGWTVDEQSSPPHTLPATTEYFYWSQYALGGRGGLNSMCKRCMSEYGKARTAKFAARACATKATQRVDAGGAVSRPLLTLKYPRYPKRMETIAQEVRDHVEAVRTQRIAQQEVDRAIEQAQQPHRFDGPTKICGGYKRMPHELPLLAEHFHYRKRKSSRNRGGWHPLCRQCKKAKREDQRAARAKA